MVRIRIKLRLSAVSGKAGTIYYQVSHKKEVKHITTNIRQFLPVSHSSEWGREDLVYPVSDRLALLQQAVEEAGSSAGGRPNTDFLYFPAYLGQHRPKAQRARRCHQWRNGAYFRKDHPDLFVFHWYFSYRPCERRIGLFAVQGQAGITVWPLAGFESHFGGWEPFLGKKWYHDINRHI